MAGWILNGYADLNSEEMLECGLRSCRKWAYEISVSRPFWSALMTKGITDNCLRLALAGAISMGSCGCQQVSSVWNGSWKLDQTKSSVPFPSFTITITPSGEYQYDNGTYGYTFRCDGRDYATSSGRTVSCLQGSALAIELTAKDATRVATAHWGLSADGKVLTIKLPASQAGGSAKTKERVYVRLSGSPHGFAGEWKDQDLEARPHVLVLALKGSILHYAFPERDQYADLPLDGSDVPWQGPGIPPGVTVAIKPNGPYEFLTLRKFRGRITNRGYMRVGATGRTLIEEFWGSGRPDQRAVLTYEKQ